MKIAALSLALSLFTATAWSAAKVGDELPAFTLKDQAGVLHTLDDSVQRIYANGDRKGDELMKTAMTGLGQAQLDAQKAVVVAEISAAPFFVKSIIRSSLKDRRYTTWLDTSGDTKSVLPYKGNQIAVLEIEKRRIKAIRYIPDAEKLKQELAPAAPAKGN